MTTLVMLAALAQAPPAVAADAFVPGDETPLYIQRDYVPPLLWPPHERVALTKQEDVRPGAGTGEAVQSREPITLDADPVPAPPKINPVFKGVDGLWHWRDANGYDWHYSNGMWYRSVYRSPAPAPPVAPTVRAPALGNPGALYQQPRIRGHIRLRLLPARGCPSCAMNCPRASLCGTGRCQCGVCA